MTELWCAFKQTTAVIEANRRPDTQTCCSSSHAGTAACWIWGGRFGSGNIGSILCFYSLARFFFWRGGLTVLTFLYIVLLSSLNFTGFNNKTGSVENKELMKRRELPSQLMVAHVQYQQGDRGEGTLACWWTSCIWPPLSRFQVCLYNKAGGLPKLWKCDIVVEKETSLSATIGFLRR